MKTIPWPIIDKRTQEQINTAAVFGKLSISGVNNNYGNHIRIAEKKIAAFFNFPDAVLVNSGSNAILIALQAIGIKKNDKVLVTSLTWVGCFTSIIRIGAIPIFVDVRKNELIGDYEQYKSDHDIKAILAVHTYGSLVDIQKLRNIFPDIPIIEDCSHTLITIKTYQNPVYVGDMIVFSLQASKILTAGEGGVILCTNENKYNLLRALRMDGRNYVNPDKINIELEPTKYHGSNFTIPDLSAALLCDQLEKFPDQCRDRALIAKQFTVSLNQMNDINIIIDDLCIDSGMFYGLPIHFKSDINKANVLIRKFEKILNLNNIRIYPSVTENPLFNPSSIPYYSSLYNRSLANDFPNSLKMSKSTIVIPHYYFLKQSSMIEDVISTIIGSKQRFLLNKISASSEQGITVIILYKGREKFIEDAIQSVFNQDIDAKIQILIICDNVSYKPRHKKNSKTQIEVLSLMNNGYFKDKPIVYRVSMLRNLSLDFAKYQYIAFLDDDNYWASNHLSSLYNLMNSSNFLGVHSWRRLIDQNNKPWIPTKFPWISSSQKESDELYEIYIQAGLLNNKNNILKDTGYIHWKEKDFGTVDMGAWLFNKKLFDLIRFETSYTQSDINLMATEDDKLLKRIKELSIEFTSSHLPTLYYRLGGYSNCYSN